MKAKENHSALIFLFYLFLTRNHYKNFVGFGRPLFLIRFYNFFFQEINDVEILRAKRDVESSSAKSGSYNISRVSNIESDNSQNVGMEDYNNISDRIFPHFTTPSIKISLG